MLRSRIALVAVLAAGALGAASADAPAVLQLNSTTPPSYALAVPADLYEIWAFFNGPLAPLPAGAVRVAGTMSGLHTGEVVRADNVIIFRNQSEPYFPGEMIVVSYHRDIQNTSGESLTGGRLFAFTIASGTGSLDWSAREGWGAADIPYFIHGGDLDNDGRPDVAAPNEGTDDVSVFLNGSGEGTFPLHLEYAVGDKPSSVFGEDFDNDGDQDLATADIISGTVSVLKNNGDGSFAPKTTYAAGLSCRQIHGGDFDGDNDVDLCATVYGSDRVLVYRNAGDGTFIADAPITTVSDGPFAIRTGDFDGDRHLDIGVACQNADSLTVLRNNGTGGFARTGTWRIGDGPWCLNGNDLDGDGDFDLASVASVSNQLAVLFNDGAGGFPTRHLAPTGAYPLGVFNADLDGDGDIDGTSSNFTAGTVGVYVNPGNGLLALQETLPVFDSGSYTWAHDLDGDGDLDLSVVDELADSLFVFFNGAWAAGIPDAGGSPVPAIPNGGIGGPELRIFPNPADVAGGATVLLSGTSGPIELSLYAMDGRRVRRITGGEAGPAFQAENGASLHLEFRDEDGAALPTGRYLLELRSSGGRAFRPIAVRRR